MSSGLQALLKGTDHLCTHPGSSQYSDVGTSSACGLAAMNCVRYIFSAEKKGDLGFELLSKLLLKRTMEDIMSICSRWTSNSHLEIDDIYKTPLFEASLKLVRTEYGKAGRSRFRRMLSYLSELSSTRENSNSCAVVITRPPEIVVCLRIVHPPREFFVIFDSHPRPEHPGGAAFFFSASIDSAALYLSDLFSVDPRLLDPNSGLQWQAELLAHVSGHFFVPSNVDMRMSQVAEEAFLEANCSVLSVNAQRKEALSQCAALTAEIKGLRKNLELMEGQLDILRRERVYRFPQVHNESYRPNNTIWTGSNSRKVHESGSTSRVGASIDQCVPGHLPRSRTTPPQRTNGAPPELGGPLVRSCGKGKRKESYATSEDDFEMAARMQIELQLEDSNLAFQLQQLQATFTQETFDCSICMDQLPIDDVARLDDCDHIFCRACIRQYISTMLDERKFPIPCPCCSAEKDGGLKGTISVGLVHQIGVSEQAYAVFNELQITKFSVPIHCRKCNRSGFVDKVEFENNRVLLCPFPNCSYSWCKECQQEVSTETGGPTHSCDGSDELNHLMSRQGWKHCPGCKTPTEKIHGCNHMTCGSPGCNTHFCYVCGGLIVQSSQRDAINAAVSAHYRNNCQLFHVPQEN